MGAGLPAGADYKMHRTTGDCFDGNYATGAEFDVVWMGTESKERRERVFSRGHDKKLCSNNRRSRCNAFAA
jgi:hypothetical protein